MRGSSRIAADNKMTGEKDMVIDPDLGHGYMPFGLDKKLQFMLEML